MYTTRIYYQDTDAGGVVYYANYFKFFEKSWFEYLLSIGINIPEWQEKDTYIIIRMAKVELLEKVRYGEIISVSSSIVEVHNAFFLMEHTVIRDGKVVAKGQTKIVCINREGRPKRIPFEFKERLLLNIAPSYRSNENP
ncbi:MAG: acyl-CoA thioesterase [Syntrophorhabdaceae bacterium]|nr:acyl-CoA thioesterase [Syntrophorhabdaceae bacterium]